jgi:hypothetical protein
MYPSLLPPRQALTLTAARRSFPNQNHLKKFPNRNHLKKNSPIEIDHPQPKSSLTCLMTHTSATTGSSLPGRLSRTPSRAGEPRAADSVMLFLLYRLCLSIHRGEGKTAGGGDDAQALHARRPAAGHTLGPHRFIRQWRGRGTFSPW